MHAGGWIDTRASVGHAEARSGLSSTAKPRPVDEIDNTGLSDKQSGLTPPFSVCSEHFVEQHTPEPLGTATAGETSATTPAIRHTADCTQDKVKAPFPTFDLVNRTTAADGGLLPTAGKALQ